MITGQFDRDSLPAMEAAYRFRMQRHVILANNVANIEVPGFRAKDVGVSSFQAMLRKAIEARDSGQSKSVELTGTDTVSVQGNQLTLKPNEAFEGNMRLDKNTVVLDREFNKMLENGLHMMTLERLIAGQYTSLQEAWQGRSR
jgi:flagellar basal-body rod protein FlgB